MKERKTERRTNERNRRNSNTQLQMKTDKYTDLDADTMFT